MYQIGDKVKVDVEGEIEEMGKSERGILYKICTEHGNCYVHEEVITKLGGNDGTTNEEE